MAAKSPGFSMVGPEVILIPTPNSLAIILARVVLPKPEGHTIIHDLRLQNVVLWPQ